MAPALFFALALFAADPDAAVATQTPDAQPSAGLYQPASEYELVAWCYGALGAHMGLHDVAMPEVERIEREFERIPGAHKADMASYDVQQKEGKKQLALYRAAMTSAEKASIKPIQPIGVAAIRKGEAVWSGAAMANPKTLAREWMSWELPEKCAETAKSLETRASVLGQALIYNAPDEAPPTTDEGAAAPQTDEAPAPSDPVENTEDVVVTPEPAADAPAVETDAAEQSDPAAEPDSDKPMDEPAAEPETP